MKLSLLNYCLVGGLVAAQGDIAALLQTQPDLSTLLSLVQLANLNSTLSGLSNVTIFAPTNAAFASLNPDFPEGVAVINRNSTSVAALLANHVFNGSYPASSISEVPIFVQTLLTPEYENEIQPFTDITGGQYNGLILNGNQVQVLSGEFTVSNVIQADIRLGDGIIIHVVDTVLLFGPPLQLFTARAQYSTFNGAFNTYGPNLSLGLTGPEGVTDEASNDLTVFVPTNDAFSLISSIVNGADNETLNSVLSYHVISNNIIFSPSLSNTSVTSLQSTDLDFTVLPNGTAFVNGAKILIPNVILSNGVCHIIDSVLNPTEEFDRESFDFGSPASERVAFVSATADESITVSVSTFIPASTESSSIPAIFTTAPVVAIPTTTRPTSPATFTGAAVSRSPKAGLVLSFMALIGGVLHV